MVLLRRILVATDFGPASQTAVAYGRALAGAFGATLHLLNVVDEVGARVTAASAASGYFGDFTRLQADIEAAADERLHLVAEEDARDVKANVVHITSSQTAAAIVCYAKTAGVDLIVIGTHGRGPLSHMLRGSVAERVVRMAPCPVLTVKNPEHEFVVPDPLTAPADERSEPIEAIGSGH